MVDVQLILDGEIMDLQGQEFPVTYQVNDIAELKDLNSNFSGTINLPPTDENKRKLGFANVIGSQTTKPYRKLSAKIIEDGVETTNGIAIVTSSENGFKAIIQSGNASFFNLVQGKNIQDLDFSALDDEWSRPNMVSWLGSPTSPTFFIVQDGTQTSLANVHVENQFPSLYVRDILAKIASEVGYSFSGSVFDDEVFNKEYIPFTNSTPETGLIPYMRAVSTADYTIGITEDGLGGSVVSPQTIMNADDSVDGYDVFSAYNPTTGIFTTPLSALGSGRLTAKFKIRTINNGGLPVGNLSPAPYVKIIAYRQPTVGPIQVLDTQILYPTHQNGTVFSGLYDIVFDKVIPLFTGGDIFFKVEAKSLRDQLNLPNYMTTYQIVSGVETYWQIDKDGSGGYGFTWKFSKNLPSISQTDFLKAFANRYGLIPLTDNYSQTVEWVRFQEIVDNKAIAKDWGKYLRQDPADIACEFHPSTYGQTNGLRYKSDENVTDQLGDGFIVVDDETLTPVKDIINLPFAASNMTTIDGSRYIWEVLRVKGGETVTPEPRILIGESIPLSIGISDPGGGGPVSTYAYGRFIDPRESRNAGFDNSLIDENYLGVKGMLNKFKKITPIMSLPNTEIQQLNYKIPIYLPQVGEYFYLNKIPSRIAGKLHKVELIRI